MSLPPGLLETARAYAAGELRPVVPRDAATVLLLREGADGPEVYVMVRRTSMAFAGGMVAFPGGRVEPEDAAELPDDWPGRMSCEASVAAAVVGAAIREFREETGVELTVDQLGLWDAWTTPEFEPRRYRTWFFTAELPAGQEPRELSTESASVTWVSAAQAVAKVDSGEWAMLPPTYLSCLRLATFGSVADVMAATREAAVEMFLPVLDGDTLTSPAWVTGLLEGRG
ncbi:MAG TPA: NUDIX domain-containing protein [Nocardioides sp.]|uniref:NUDIX hydrolase n=1 Tax=Nocardioides sp. TaxID=35761 RepID=UPI002ED79E40